TFNQATSCRRAPRRSTFPQPTPSAGPGIQATAAMPATPFHLECSRANGVIGYAAAVAMRGVAWAVGLRACASIYARLQTPSEEPFDARVLRELQITPECDP